LVSSILVKAANQNSPAARNGVWRQAIAIARQASLRDGARFVRAARATPAVQRDWLDFLHAYAAEHVLPAADADLLMKPLRQYMIKDLPLEERIRLLRTHYTLLAELAGPALPRAIWNGGEVALGTLEGRSGRYGLRLCDTARHQTRKEGEITLVLRPEGHDQPLAKLTFLLASTEQGRRGLMIGGLQGPRSADAKDAIVATTRDLHGMRPRDAVLTAAMGIARAIGAREIWAVPSNLHVHNARERRVRAKLFVNYDEVWIERGADRDWPFGWIFQVPPRPVHSGKTSQGCKRDAVKDTIWALAQTVFAPEPVGDLLLAAHAG
jgi:uncharacterized protein VirK/YbjX